MNERHKESKILQADFLIVGGGLAGVTAAESLRARDADSSVVILSAEAMPPYHRPPLSKGYLLGNENEARLFIHPESFYQDHNIGLLLNTRALSVNPTRKSVSTTAGEIGYGQLLLATGGTPKPLRAPGTNLRGIFKISNKNDADALRKAALNGKRALIVGGSFLGMEIAVSLRRLGLNVAIVETGDVLLPYLGAPDLSAYFKRYVENSGVSVFLNETVAALHGGDHIEGAETTSGRTLPCDLTVVAIGISPATDFLSGSGIALEDGYVDADERLRTNVPNVYAAGDVTSFFDPVFGRRRHIQHWDNAIKQGRLAAYNMLGRRTRYDELSYFYSDLGDISFAVLGAPEKAEEWIGRGSLDERSYALFYLKNNGVRALFTTGRPASETRDVEGLIRYRANVGEVKERLVDPSFSLDTILVQTALILQGGGALGAFECGVVRALEEDSIFPDVVAGVSIGAFNGAIIAANPRNATKALEAFWRELAVASLPIAPLPPPILWNEKTAIALQIMAFGVPNFFKPRWLPPFSNFVSSPMNWTSLYDPTAIKKLISNYVDFAALKRSPIRLLISSVNVETAELEVFDSYIDDFTPDHVLASGSLPPGFPWTMIDGKAFWDGGIVSNSPLDLVKEHCGPGRKRVFVVDLFLRERALPANMLEVMARRDEIVYAERIRKDVHYAETASAYHALVDDIMQRLNPDDAQKIKQWPAYIQLMGYGAAPEVVRIVRPPHEDEPASRDYDFSDIAIEGYQREGYLAAKLALAEFRQGST